MNTLKGLRLEVRHNGTFLVSERGVVAELSAGYQQTREEDGRAIVAAVRAAQQEGR